MFTGEQIRRKRKEQGMSAEDLANYLNLNKENVYKWERGHKPNNAEDYIKIENWLAGKVEGVPKKEVPKEEIGKAYDKDQTISDQAYSIRKLTDTNAEMVQMHREFLEKIFANLNTSGAASEPSKKKEKASKPRHFEEIPDKKESDSETSPREQKGTVRS